MVGLNNTTRMPPGEECVEAGVEEVEVGGAEQVEEERDWAGDVVGFAREKLGVEPDGLQEELLRCEGRQVILNCSRQWGKSTMAAVKAVHRAWTVAGATVIVASPSERQSAELMVKALLLNARTTASLDASPPTGRSLHASRLRLCAWWLGSLCVVFRRYRC